MKLVICPLTVIASSYLFPNVNYASLYQPIILGFILAVAGVMMEYLFLREGTVWLSTAMDFAASVLIVYFVSQFFVGAAVTFFGAILTGLLLAVTEYFTHNWLIRTGRTQKSR
jgi:uncharacterized membrane protein